MAIQNKKGISWTDATWSPFVGCSKISDGCLNCWSEKAAILHYHKDFPVGWNGTVRYFPERLYWPAQRKKGMRVAVQLMGDIFHEQIPDSILDEIFRVMLQCPQHTFQILTKRHERLYYYTSAKARGEWFKRATNIWWGVTAENQAMLNLRYKYLMAAPVALRYLSIEPMLGYIDTNQPVELAQQDVDAAYWKFTRSSRGKHPSMTEPLAYAAVHVKPDWVICGGESGHKARQCDIAWIRSLIAQCKTAGIPVHVKQLGQNAVDMLGPMRGAMYSAKDKKGAWLESLPPDLRLREFPSINGEWPEGEI